jgi:hypothetical protein
LTARLKPGVTKSRLSTSSARALPMAAMIMPWASAHNRIKAAAFGSDVSRVKPFPFPEPVRSGKPRLLQNNPNQQLASCTPLVNHVSSAGARFPRTCAS